MSLASIAASVGKEGATVRCYSVFDPFYHSYYLLGLAALFGRAALRVDSQGFPPFDRDGLAFVVEPAGLRVYMDSDDFSGFDAKALAWCDVYAKVNLDLAGAPFDGRATVVPAGPCFAVCAGWLWRLAPASLWAARVRAGGEKSALELAQRWWWMTWDRLPISAYRPTRKTQANYIFMATSVWAPDDRCNQLRTRFIDAARELPWVRFEGGFVPPHRSDVPEAQERKAPRRYPLGEYLAHTRRSSLAFNTPGVLDCLSWKLGEYLALGKAVLTTPLSRAMPVPLEHGRHVHFAGEDQASMEAGIRRLCSDSVYRRRLERGARAYYDQYLAPPAAVARILQAGGLMSAEAVA